MPKRGFIHYKMQKALGEIGSQLSVLDRVLPSGLWGLCGCTLWSAGPEDAASEQELPGKAMGS